MTDVGPRDEAFGKAKALLEPRLERQTRQFQDRLKAIRLDPVKKREWEEARIVEDAVGDYVSALVTLVSDAISKTFNAIDAHMPGTDVERLFLELLPSLGDTRTFVYLNAQGLGFQAGVGFTLAIEDAYRLGVQEKRQFYGYS